jgi:hypothetical protein
VAEIEKFTAPWETERVLVKSRPMRRVRFTMCGMSDSRAGHHRQKVMVDRIETVPVTAEQYDQAVKGQAV